MLGPAWVAWLDGDPLRARQLLVDGAEVAIGDENLMAAGWLLHDAARLGATGIATRFSRLLDRSRSALLAVRAAHVDALEGHDPDALERASTSFASLGLDLFAAEAAWSASDGFRRAGDQRAGTRLAQRAEALARRCPGVRTPGLFRPEGPSPLTTREREVAGLASGGLSSAAIAQRLHLSVRTVDNHLQHAYAKLGVTKRDQLAAVLSPS